MPKQYVSNEDVSVRIFRSDVLEWFSHVHPAVPHVLYWPVVGLALWRGAARGVPAGRLAMLAAAGVVLWTIAEYLVHRFVFHAGPAIESEVRTIVAGLGPGEPALRAMRTWRQRHYFLAHGVHHDFPNDTRRLVMPPSVSIPLAVVCVGLFRWGFGAADGPALFAGLVMGYIAYDTIHYAVHHLPLRGMVPLFLKKHHFRHHYQDSTKNFGVSSPVWDFGAGTLRRG
jgi:4-hydroxysphinganine ceramide fatty acyl 2-hydroxylase